MSKTIVFFGSGPVAAESLRLLAQDFTIEAVITKPRPAHHKGEVPVLDVAEKLNLPIFTVTDKNSLDELIATQPVQSVVAVLIDFGIIVSQDVIDYFPLGIINSHFSLLPEWRGADPITFSVLSGQPQTGVSLMLLVAKMDEGPLLAQAALDIDPDCTTPQLTDQLIDLSYQMLKEVLPAYMNGQVDPAPQESVTLADSKTPTYSRKLTKDDGIINWTKPAVVIEREIRAFAGWPKSSTQFNGLSVVITVASSTKDSGEPGTTTILDKKPLVYCGEGALVIRGIKPAGKREMTGEAFLAGYKQTFLG